MPDALNVMGSGHSTAGPTMELVINPASVETAKRLFPAIPRSWPLLKTFVQNERVITGRFTICRDAAGYTVCYEMHDGSWTMFDTVQLTHDEGRRLMLYAIRSGQLQSCVQN